jgi:nucleotide-binding universal stress UspA family protein
MRWTPRSRPIRAATSPGSSAVPLDHASELGGAGDPAERLVAVAEDERVETIVLGNRGTHGSWWRVRDSVPNIVLRHAPCSVMIVDTRAAR